MILMDGSLNEKHPSVLRGAPQEHFHLGDIHLRHEALSVNEHNGLFWNKLLLFHGKQPSVENYAELKTIISMKGEKSCGTFTKIKIINMHLKF